jgi:tRNA-Thr(GGU) m(6)t(6)A37 methyltransferase TsaA
MSKKIRENQFLLTPIGRIRRGEEGVQVELEPSIKPALKQLGHFSHVMVFWWANHFDNEEAREMLRSISPYAPDHECGVFATRSPYRPNPIMMTTCKLLEVDEESGIVRIAEIDAFDGSTVVDLKAYFPVCDRVKEPFIPAWLSDWPDWMPEDGIGLEEYEKDQSAVPDQVKA